MRIADLLGAIETELVAIGGWDTAPASVWVPDFALKDLQSYGLTAWAIAPEGMQTLTARGGATTRRPKLHVAVMKPTAHPTTAAGRFTEGKTVSDKAEDVAAAIIGKKLLAGDGYAAVMSAEHGPTISADHLKQYNLLVSYIVFELQTGKA